MSTDTNTSSPSNYSLFYLLLFILLGWSAFDFGGRYLHVQMLSQIMTGGLLCLLGFLFLRIPIERMPLKTPILLLSLSYGLSFVFSVNQLASLEEIFRMGMYLSVLIVAFYVSKDQADKLIIGFVLIGLCVCLWGWTALFSERLSSTFYRTNDLAGYLLLLFPLACHQFLHLKDFKSKLFYGLASAVFIMTFIFTYSRSAWIAGIIALSLVLWGNRKKISKKQTLVFLSVASVCVALAFVFNLGSLVQRVGSLQHILSENSATWRLDLYQVAWHIFLDHPVLGSGPNTYGVIYPAYQLHPGYFSINAHNFYLQLLAEQGAFGLLAFLTFIGVLFTKIYQTKTPYAVGILGSLCGSLVHIAFDIDWSVSAIPIAFFFLAGVGLSSSKTPSKTHVVFTKSFKLGVIFSAAFALLVLPAMNYFSASAHAKSQSAFVQNDFQLTKQALHRAISLAPWPSARHYISLGKLYLSQKEYPKAMLSLTKALHLSPYHSDTYDVLSKVFKVNQKIDEAIQVLEKRLVLNPLKHPSFYGDIGDLLLEQKKWKQAIKWYQLGIEKFPEAQLSRYERYTPRDRYELFMLYRSLEIIYSTQNEGDKSKKAGTKAQKIIKAAKADLLTGDSLFSTPVKALEKYWIDIDEYIKTGKASFPTQHPKQQFPLPPRTIKLNPKGIKYLSAKRGIRSAQLIYEIPAKAAQKKEWGRMRFKDNLTPFDGKWTIYQRELIK